MPEIQVDPQRVAYCGLYCGACRSFLKGKCPGCHQNAKATWCQVRSCCTALNIPSCASCPEFTDPMACRKFNNFMSRLFGFIFSSDRAACIRQIKELGIDGHAEKMAGLRAQTIKRGRAR